MREWLTRLWDWIRRDRLDRELRDELAFHAERLERDARAEGATTVEAQQAARRRLGNVTRAREEARDRWSWPWLDHLLQDVRYAFRGLGRSPGFTLTVALTLGLGIGANAAMFGVIDRLMFRPFPYLHDPGAVNRVYLQRTERGGEVTSGDGFEYTRYLDLRRWTTKFSQLAAFADRHLAVGSGDAAAERPVMAVSGSFFDFFDAKPALGRFFGPADDSLPAGSPVAVLGYDYWQSQMGGRDDVVGRTLRVRDIACTIVGVAPRGFVGVSEGEPPDVFIPITTYAGSQSFRNEDGTDYYTQYHWGWLAVMARRAPGVSEAAASGDLTQAYLQSWNAEKVLGPLPPAGTAHPRGIAGPLKSAAGPGAGLESTTLLWVGGVALIVLLIACANVTNLMLARMLRRRRETAVRLALGVSRGRLLAQGLTESLVLAGLGCLAGVLIAQWGGAALRHLFLRDQALGVIGDSRTLGLAAVVAVMAGLVTGVGPAFLAGRSGDLVGGLKAGAREGGAHRSRTRTGLLIFQGALSVILLIGAGLFVRSLDHVRSMRLGYDADRVLMVSPNFRGAKLSGDETWSFQQRFLERAQRIGGVEHAALVSSVPFWSTSSTSLRVAGIDSVRKLGRFTYQTASPDYFETMGTRILRGRPFTAEDREGTPLVAVVSEAMARVLWPGKDAIGQCMQVGADTVPCTTVVGIAEDAFQNSLTHDDRFRYYLPIAQYGREAETLLLQTRNDPGQLAEPVRKVLQAEMPGDGYVTVTSLARVVESQRRAWQVGATMFAAFGVLALLVAGVGLYGLITYDVAQRRHELGVRTALGARAADLVRLVVGQGIRVTGVGILLGVGAALALARSIQPLLFQQSATDPWVYGGVAGLLLAVALAASLVPARRATAADPNEALRGE